MTNKPVVLVTKFTMHTYLMFVDDTFGLRKLPRYYLPMSCYNWLYLYEWC